MARCRSVRTATAPARHHEGSGKYGCGLPLATYPVSRSMIIAQVWAVCARSISAIPVAEAVVPEQHPGAGLGPGQARAISHSQVEPSQNGNPR